MKIKLNETNLQIWLVNVDLGKHYDKNKYSFEEAVEHFHKICDDNPILDEDDCITDEGDRYYLTTESGWYICDDEYGYNLEIKIIDLMSTQGIDIEEFQYEISPEEIDIDEEFSDGHKILLTALLNYNDATDNNLKIEDDNLVGDCFRDFVDECPCKDCA